MTRRTTMATKQEAAKLGLTPTLNLLSESKTANYAPPTGERQEILAFRKTGSALSRLAHACIHPARISYPQSSSEKAQIQAQAGCGVVSPPPLGAAHACWVDLLVVRRSERTDFLLVPAPFLSPPATYWARALAGLGGSVRLAGARASLPARCSGAGGQPSGP